jgi:hypothetical protein
LAATSAAPTPTSAAPPPTPVVGPAATGVGTSILIIGDGASFADSPAPTGDERQPPAPATLVEPATPTGMELPGMPDGTVLEQIYEDGAPEAQWIAAFVDSTGPVIVPASDAETSATKVSVALAVALGGFWMNLAERPARRKRPELAAN